MILNSWNIPDKKKTRTQLMALIVRDECNDLCEAMENDNGALALDLAKVILGLVENEISPNVEDFDTEDEDAVSIPKQHVGPRVRMSSEEERRRRLKRKLDAAAKRARKHARTTIRKET